ncbi:MAG: zinc ribbon domain-containing protein [Thermoanaerobaculaceae bacterium]
MPIFEFLCLACNRIYSFLSLAPGPSKQPVCPRCGGTELSRVPSAFSVSSPAKTKPEKPVASASDDASSAQMESEMMRMMEGLDEKDAENPRVMARMMRRVAEVSGEAMTPTMEEMFRRLEAGEDPETLEEELGPQLEAEMGDTDGNGDAGPSAPTRDDGLYSL